MAAAKIPVLSWDAVRPAPVILISGPEDVLAERTQQDLRALLKAEDPSLEVSELDASTMAPGELLTLASPSLFGEPRLIRVANVQNASDAFLEEALAYLQTPEETAYLVLRHRSGQRGKKLLDAVRSGLGAGIEVACAELKRDQDRADFAAAEFRRGGKRIAPAALRQLVQAFGEDVQALGAACRQLLSDAAAEIDEALVDKYYGGRVETNSFKVADAALAGRSGEALVLLRHALLSGADPVPMVAAFAMKLRGMAKVSGSRGSAAQLAGPLGMAPWMIDRARRDLAEWSDDALGRAIQLIAETDAQVKGAGRDPEYAVERMVEQIARRMR